MEINLTTPALLFPALSLLLLTYTNRFVALANLIRNLHLAYNKSPNPVILGQIQNLRRRAILIRNMQGAGISSMLSCVISMTLIFAGQQFAGKCVFGASLALLTFSLGLSLIEIWMSVGALNLLLGHMAEQDSEPAEL